MKGSVTLSVLGAKYIHASLAPWCLAAGIKEYAPDIYPFVKIVEATVNQPESDVLENIAAESPFVVGFSCYIWNIDKTLTLCTSLKQAMPRLIIVLGGPEVSYCAKDVLEKNSQIDYILAGEGEQRLPKLLKAFLSNENPERLPERIGQEIFGLFGRRADGTIYLSDPQIQNGNMPSPLIAGYAKAFNGRIAYFETSRGCPYSCAFCLSGNCGKPRYYDLDVVLPDLICLAGSGVKTIKFVDRTFNANASHANKVLSFILGNYGKKIPLGVCFHFEIAGDILSEETFDLLEQMPPGAVQLEIGIQSFCEKALAAVNRKTNTAILRSNIKRLVSMGNMHIHIDLIAGLPYESLALFAQSFNIGYSLGAQMLQLGFLKLLHGSAMRSRTKDFPCEFDNRAPYEVRTTPWLSAEDLELLHKAEQALERVYNSGRFCLTAAYVLRKSGMTPFEFYTGLGIFAHEAGTGRGVSLDDFTAILQRYCLSLNGIDGETLRDFLVRDRLSTNAMGRLPPCLFKKDEKMSKVLKWLSGNPETAPKKGVRRGVALLYTAKTVCFADYSPENKNPVTGRWIINEILLNSIVY